MDKPKSDNFIHLHVHNEYSLLDGYGHPEEFVSVAKELGQRALATTNHGNVSDHLKHYEACKKVGIKPILGCEMYVVDDVNVRERSRWHITVLAKNIEGYINLNKLVSFSYNEGFYYKPRVDWKTFQKYSKGIIATTGCPSSKTGAMAQAGMPIENIVREVERQNKIFDDYFIELAPWKFPDGVKVANAMYEVAEITGIPMVLTMDCHYPKKEDAKVQDVLLCVQTRTKFDDPKRMKFDQQDFYMKSSEEMFKHWKEAYPHLKFKQELFDNTQLIADMVDFEFPKAKPILYPYKDDKNELLKSMCLRGMEERGFKGKKEYEDRLKRELELIDTKGYVDYFLVIADLIQWSKENGIFVGPGRGSSAGSLVCYLLKITEVDPLQFGLLFERFIDLNRTDLPDIDIDFEDERRNEVKEYLEEKYGADHVASLVTFGTFKGKMCIQDVGSVFSVPTKVTDELKGLVLQRSGGDSRFGFSIEDTFKTFDKAKKHLKGYPQLGYAKDIEGQIRHLSVHAAGVIVSNEPITNFAAFYRSSNDQKVISMDYDDASAVGLLKIDILGLTAMSVIKSAVNLIEERHGKRIDLNKLPLDDKKVYQGFQEAKLFGIFQFDGQSMMQVCKQVKPENFGELSDVNALSRPGPLHSGGTSSYIDRKFGREKVVYSHPMVEELTKETYGITVYQEQVMKIVKEIGKFSWEDTSTIRKIMSKNVGEEAFNRYRENFLKGAKENGIDEATAEEIWSSVYTHGSWSFNKSHSVSYSLIGYWMMYLKMHYPIEFYVAMLKKEKDADKMRKVVKEAISEGIELLPVDVNKSDKTFLIDGDGIRVGFLEISGVGENIAEEIVSKQPFENYIDFKEKTGLKKQSDILLEIGAFRNLEFKNLQKQASLFDDDGVDNLDFDYKNPDINTMAKHCPIMIQDNVYEDWSKWCKDNLYQIPKKIRELEIVEETDWTQVSVMGRTNPQKYYNLKNKAEEAKSKGLDFDMEGKDTSEFDFINFDLEDETDYTTVRLKPSVYRKYKKMLWDIKPDDVILVKGSVINTIRMVFGHTVVNLTELKRKKDKGEKLTKNEESVLYNTQMRDSSESIWI